MAEEPTAPDTPDVPTPGDSQAKPRITKLDRAERIDFAAECLVTHFNRADQVRAICTKYKIEWRQANRYLKLARDRILAASQQSKDQHLAESVAFYRSIALNPLQKTHDRILARKLLDRAVGIGLNPTFTPSGVSDPLAALDLAAIAQAAREAKRERVARTEQDDPPQESAPAPESEPVPEPSGATVEAVA